MRNKEEKARFCAEVMSAARRCKIGISRYENQRYTWVDPVVEAVVIGDPHPNEQDALESACEKLVDYFNQPHP